MWPALTRWPEVALRLVSAPPGMPADDELAPTAAEQLGRVVCLLEDIRNLLAQEPAELVMSQEEWDRQTGDGIAAAAERVPDHQVVGVDNSRWRVDLTETEYRRYLSGGLNFCPEGCMCPDVHADVVEPVALTDARLDDFQDRLEAAGVPAPYPAIIRETLADLFPAKPFGGLRPVPDPQK